MMLCEQITLKMAAKVAYSLKNNAAKRILKRNKGTKTKHYKDGKNI